jgi:hypothetical protein
MVALLALSMSLRGAAAEDRRAASRATDDRTIRLIKSAVTRQLVGEAMLQTADLPPGWVRDAAGAESLFRGTELEQLFMSEMRVRFQRPDTGEYIDQHLGVVPRWVLGRCARRLELAAARVRSASSGEDAAEGIDIPPLGDQSVALRVRVDGGTPGPLSVEAVFLRRGVFVMALASWHRDPCALDAPRTTRLAALADTKVARVASALA